MSGTIANTTITLGNGAGDSVSLNLYTSVYDGVVSGGDIVTLGNGNKDMVTLLNNGG